MPCLLLPAEITPCTRDAAPTHGRKLLQNFRQWATQDAINRAVNSGADLWTTRNAAGVGQWGTGWGPGWWR
jgi:hypothetical protein